MLLPLSSVSSLLESSRHSPEQIAVMKLTAALSPLRQKEGRRRRETLRVQHMEHVVGVERSFQLSQFHKHAGWKNE